MDSKAADRGVIDTMPGAEAVRIGVLYELVDELLETAFEGERTSGRGGGGSGGGFFGYGS